jgi:hypothetical protein
MDNTLELFKYFARFVPREVLADSFVQPDASSAAGYSETAQDTVNQPSGVTVADIHKYVFSADPEFVFDKLKNADGLFLFVEYGSATLDSLSVTQRIAVSIAAETNKKNMDSLNEVILMNRCKNILLFILDKLKQDIDGDCFMCGEIAGNIELVPVEPSSLKGWSGWAAYIDLQTGRTKITL